MPPRADDRDDAHPYVQDMSAIIVLVIIGLVLASFGFWVYALVDLVRRPERELQSGSKLLWLFVVVFGHFLGAALYWMLGRPQEAAA